MKKRILLLNAGYTELPLIEELKKMNCYLITSGNRADFPGHKLADKYIQADYYDKEAILKIVKKNDIDGIVSCAHDFGLISSAYVAEQMGWAGHDSVENTCLLHEKDKFKKLCLDMNIPSPKTVAFINRNTAVDFLKSVEYPIIAKAVDQASGVGINRANDNGEAIKAIDIAFENSKKKRIVIEPYIVGQQESFVAFVVDKKVISCMTCNCYSPINPYLIQTETMPSDNFEILKDQLIGITERLFEKLDLVDGIITLQYIVKNGVPYIIEAMRRCLGNQFLVPVEAVTGFPFYKALVMSELGMDCHELIADKPYAKCAGHHAIMAQRNGVYQSMMIPQHIMKHVFKYVELFKSGEEIRNYMKERLGYIYYSYRTREEMTKAVSKYNEDILLNIDYEG